MTKMVFGFKMAVAAVAAFAGNSGAMAQDVLSEAECQQIATRCIANHLGYATPNECFDAISDGRCPDRGGDPTHPGGGPIWTPPVLEDPW